MLRFFKWAGTTALVLVFAIFGWVHFTAVHAANLPPLKTGDIVFQTSTSSQSLAILLASNSAYSHIGIIEIGKDGSPQVIEAVGPVRTIPLDDWIRRGLGKRIAIKRMSDLHPEEATAIISAAHKYDGLPYDIFFLPDKDHIYCSELVRLAFSEGAGIDLGQMQRVADLNFDNFAARKVINRRWKKDPICQANGETFESCFAKILQQQLITPQSIADDTRLQTVFSNFSFLAR